MSPDDPHSQPSRDSTAHPGERRSYQRVEQQAREVLRERGLSDDQIDSELTRPHREEQDS